MEKICASNRKANISPVFGANAQLIIFFCFPLCVKRYAGLTTVATLIDHILMPLDLLKTVLYAHTKYRRVRTIVAAYIAMETSAIGWPP